MPGTDVFYLSVAKKMANAFFTYTLSSTSFLRWEKKGSLDAVTILLSFH